MSCAIYPGTFDPVHNGHLDLIERGSRLFDKLVVGVAAGHHKDALFTTDERIAILRESIGNRKGIEVLPFEGLLVDFARAAGARAVIRGLRGVSDYEFETQMAFMNRRMEPGIEIIFLPADERYACVNSSLVKEIAKLGGDVAQFVPEGVLRELAKKSGGGGE